jgi:hypothetical protein
MPPNKGLAAAFEDEIVVLDVDRGSLLLLDVWAAQVWHHCDGSTAQAIASSARGAVGRVHDTLQALTDAGLVRQVGDEWFRSPVEWV